jgi:hypothetical protein
MKRHDRINYLILAVLLLFILIGSAPFSVPNWAVVAFVLVVFLIGISVSVKRMRAELRLGRTIWRALTRSH